MTSKLDTAGLVERLRTDAAYANDRIGSTIRAIGRDCAEAASQLSALQERVERAERERDEAMGARNENAKLRGQRDAALAKLEAAEARVAELEAALRPFADLGEEAAWMTTKPDDAGAWGFDGVTVTWGDFRRARAALAHKGEGR